MPAMTIRFRSESSKPPAPSTNTWPRPAIRPPVYYQRYMIDYNNRPVDVENAARDRIYWFFSLDAVGRRQYSEDTATNVYYEQMATHWGGNWAKLFFNNKGVVAKATDVCMQYPQADPAVWNWGPNERPAG